jgi:16S rRNA (cytosine967-C5)-methyltransferase
VSDAREIASRVLRRVRRDGAYANLALSGALDQARLADADRALATELVYGVLRHRRRLDHALGLRSRRPVERIDADTLDVMRIAAYQLLQLDRVPRHAAVNEGVGLVRRLRGAKVAGFANAVLRRVDAESWSTGLPADPVARLALECSLPEALVWRWIGQLGRSETEALAHKLLERAPLAVRCNAAKASRDEVRRRLEQEGARVESGRWAPMALRVERLPDPFRAASYLDGLWTVQDEGAQLVTELVQATGTQRVLDACAGVGGKTTDLAARARDGSVVAVDLSPVKLQLLQDHCRRLGLRCEVRQLDLTEAGALGTERFDRVLLDAPCSGLGLLRRHPELKWRWEERSVERLARLQRELLANLVPAVRPGGLLIYSVCTTTDEEGPEQARWLTATFPQLQPDPPTDPPLSRLWAGEAALTLWPHRHDTDGFFIARFRRRNS